MLLFCNTDSEIVGFGIFSYSLLKAEKLVTLLRNPRPKITWGKSSQVTKLL